MFNHYYVGDFENTTNTESTYVYGAGFMSLEDSDVTIFDNIDDAMNYLSKLPSKSCVYFHNFASYDGWIVLDWLLKHGFVYSTDRNVTKRFNGIITDDRQIYQLKVRFGKHNVEFRDTCKLVAGKLDKIGKDFKCPTSKLVGSIDYDKKRDPGYVMDDVERAYLRNDVLLLKEILEKILTMGRLSNFLTAGSFAFHELKCSLYQDTHHLTDDEMEAKRLSKWFNKDIQDTYRTFFPELPQNIDKMIRKAYRGGYCYNHTDGEIYDGDGIVLDVNSLYPFSMTSCNGTRHPYPYGKPRYFSGNRIPSCECFIVHIMSRFRLKKGCLPFIQIKGSPFFAENEYLSETDTELEFWLTSVDLRLFLDCYDQLYFEVLEGFEFSSYDGFFDNFVMKHYQLKKNAKSKTERTVAKICINSSYGKTGARLSRMTGIPELDGDTVHLNLVDSNLTPNSTFIPVACFVCAYGRDLIIRSAMKAMETFGEDCLAYIDTDSLHLKGVSLQQAMTIFDIDDSDIGKFACEAEFKRGRWVRQKTYIEEFTKIDGDWIFKKDKDGKFIFDENGDKIRITQISIKACGLTEDGKQVLLKMPDVFERFTYGLSLEGCKLMKRTVDGGASLYKANFNIRPVI